MVINNKDDSYVWYVFESRSVYEPKSRDISFTSMYAPFGRTQLKHDLILSGVTLHFQIKIIKFP